jgi:hypothetical protein
MSLQELQQEIDRLKNEKKKFELTNQEIMTLRVLLTNKDRTPKQDENFKILSEKQRHYETLREELKKIQEEFSKRKKESQLSVVNILEDFDDGGSMDVKTLVPEDATKIIKYEGRNTTFLNEILRLSVTDSDNEVSSVGVKDISDLIYVKKIKFDKAVDIDGKKVYPIDCILFNPDIDNRINTNFISVLRVLNQAGVEIDVDRVRRESTPKVQKIVEELITTIQPKQIKIPSNPGACSKIPAWDWKSGDVFEKDDITYDYFYCAEYYFDGEYQLVKFPKGMTVFRGSAIITDKATSYPIDIGWFTNLRNAMEYKLKQDCVFLLLDNQYNLDKLLKHPKMTEDALNSLRKLFGIKKDYKKTFNTSNNPMNIINIEHIIDIEPTPRESLFGDDKTFAQWICEHVIYENYSGYCAPQQNKKPKAPFHLEFIFCNPLLYLESDMFYDPENYPPNVRELFNQMKIPSNPGACSKIPAWDWKSGDVFEKDDITYDYFYCGEYYFDGEYQLVKFPKGMTVFHGSAIIANEATSYPIGIKYYDPQRFEERLRKKYEEVPSDIAKNSPHNLQQLLSQYVSIDIGWFTNRRNAMLYSRSNEVMKADKPVDKIPGCKDFCIHAYKLKQDCVFLLLDNQYNLDKLLNHPKMTEDALNSLRKMFSIKKDYKKTFNTSNNPMNIINIEPTLRESLFGDDKTFAQWICEHVIYGNYSGYCAPQQNKKAKAPFHLEFIFCNPLLYLERDLTNGSDMFYDPENYPPNVRELFNQMKKYETTNTNFHSGNIFEHSIWSLLFSEHISGRTTPPVDERLKKVIIASALIHDIGKMNPASCELNDIRKKYIYRDIEQHPQIGAKYFDTGIPILDDNLIDTKRKLMPQDIIKDILPDATPEEIDVVRNAVLFHWHFGSEILSKFAKKNAIYESAIIAYVKMFNGAANKLNSIMATIIVSIADIEATQPYTKQKLDGLSTDEIRAFLHSKILPYIVSKPKVYRGTDLPSQINASKTGIEALNDVMRVYKKQN